MRLSFWKSELMKTTQKSLDIKPALFEVNDNEHEVYNEDANFLIVPYRFNSS